MLPNFHFKCGFAGHLPLYYISLFLLKFFLSKTQITVKRYGDDVIDEDKIKEKC